MLIDQVRKLTPLDRLVYFIRERESIRLKREAGEKRPWTDDVILQSYRFCNVRRMDDKVSRWLLANWYEPYQDHSNMLLAAALARHFNLPAALSAIGFPTEWEPERVKSTLRKMKASGQRIFNGAYMVRGIGTADKTEMVVSRVVQPLVENPPPIVTDSFQRSVEALLPYWGFSTFMAGQVVADLRWAMTGNWADRLTWAPAGPGSIRGMNRLHMAPLKTPMKQDRFLVWLRDLVVCLKKELPETITSRLELMDYQNCLCEIDKYSRALLGEGKPKQRYNGEYDA